MRLFKWRTAIAVNLPEIDPEHRELYRIAEELRVAVTGGFDAAAISPLLDRLVHHLSEHFAHEETLMRESNYTAFAWHARQHRTASDKSAALIAQIREGKSAAAVDLLEFLSGWLKDHISVADKMMGAYLRNQRRLALVSPRGASKTSSVQM